MKPYKLYFFRSPVGDEIGPQDEVIKRVCKNKTDALKTANNEAITRGWRVIDIVLDVKPMNAGGCPLSSIC